MPPTRIAPGESAPPARARRTIFHYEAKCQGCEEIPTRPREATVHAMKTGHTVAERKYYLLEMDE